MPIFLKALMLFAQKGASRGQKQLQAYPDHPQEAHGVITA